MDSRVAAAVAVGGICGATLRWAIVEASATSSWPTGVFVANLFGCAVLGLVVGRYPGPPTGSVFVGVTVGFCGALTTFSAFALDLAVFLDESRWLLFVGYLTASFGTGFVLFLGGLLFGRVTSRRAAP